MDIYSHLTYDILVIVKKSLVICFVIRYSRWFDQRCASSSCLSKPRLQCFTGKSRAKLKSIAALVSSSSAPTLLVMIAPQLGDQAWRNKGHSKKSTWASISVMKSIAVSCSADTSWYASCSEWSLHTKSWSPTMPCTFQKVCGGWVCRWEEQ